MAELLIEIGFEEMPAPWLAGLAEQLRTRFVEAAAREFLEAKDASVAWTPRRLVLQAELPARQSDREEPVWGPALKVAKDAGGRLDPRGPGLREEERRCGRRSCCSGPRTRRSPRAQPALRAQGRRPRRPASSCPACSRASCARSRFPKRMSWDAWLEDGRGAFPFGRPIRWLVVLFDGSLVPFRVHALESGARGAVVVESRAETRGHRFLPKGLRAGATRRWARSPSCASGCASAS